MSEAKQSLGRVVFEIKMKFSIEKSDEAMNTKIKKSPSLEFFLRINVSSFSSKKIRPRDCVAFGSLSRYLLKIAV